MSEYRKLDNDFYEVACRSCGYGGSWSVFFDGKSTFKARHSCGHIITIKPSTIVNHPDYTQ